MSPRDAETAGSFPALGGFAYFHLQVHFCSKPKEADWDSPLFHATRGFLPASHLPFSGPGKCRFQGPFSARPLGEGPCVLVVGKAGLDALAQGRGQLCRLDTEGHAPFIGQGPGWRGRWRSGAAGGPAASAHESTPRRPLS